MTQVIYKTDSQIQKTYGYQGESGGDESGVWGSHMHTTIYRTDNQQGPTILHRKLYSVPYKNWDGKEPKAVPLD